MVLTSYDDEHAVTVCKTSFCDQSASPCQVTLAESYLDIRRSGIKFIQERWKRMRSDMGGRSNAVSKSVLEVLRSYSVRVVGWRSESNWEITEDCIEQSLCMSTIWSTQIPRWCFTSVWLETSHSNIRTFSIENINIRFRGSFSPMTRSVTPTKDSSPMLRNAMKG